MRATPALIVLGAMALVALVWLTSTSTPVPSELEPNGPTGSSFDEIVPPERSATLNAPTTPAEEADGAATRVDATGLDGPRTDLPTTLQGLHGKVVLPSVGDFRLSDTVLEVRRDGRRVGSSAIPRADGTWVLECESPETDLTLTVAHPGCAPLDIGPFDLGRGERRPFGVLRPTPAATRTIEVRTASGMPAASAAVWVLPGGLTSGPIDPSYTDVKGRSTVTVPLLGGRVLARWKGHLSEDILVSGSERDTVLITIEDRDGPQGSELSVRGTVLDRTTGDPLPGAAVDLLHGSSRLFRSVADSEGRFDLGDGYDTRFAIRVSAPGFETRTMAGVSTMAALGEGVVPLGRVVDAPATPLAGDAAQWAEVALEVVDQFGTALEGAEVRAHAALLPDGFSVPLGELDLLGRTDPLGRVRFRADANASHGPWVHADGMRPVQLSADEIVGTAEPNVVTLVPGAAVEGRVVDSEGRGVFGCRVNVLGRRGRLPSLMTDRDGHFRSHAIEPQPVTLIATPPGGFESLGRAPALEVDLRSATRRLIEIRLQSGVGSDR